jgi:hypothetical protein
MKHDVSRHCTAALVLGLLIAGATAPLQAQPSAPPPVKSALTGVTLPVGSRLDKGAFSRAAARAMMDMESKKLNVTLGGALELFRLPTTKEADFIGPLVTQLREQGFTVSMSPRPATWGVIEKGGTRFMAYFDGRPNDPWLYLGDVTGTSTLAGPSQPSMPAAGRAPSNSPAATTAPTAAATPAPTPQPSPAPTATAPRAPNDAASAYRFTSTTFTDGWVGREERNWVRGSRGGVEVLVHFAQYDLRPFMNLDEATAHVWTSLVVPRFRDITNVRVRRSWWADGGPTGGRYFASADATEQASGKRVHVALFRDGSFGRWIEIRTADRATFERELTVVYDQDGTNWTALANLANLNRFAVAASDLTGVWKGSSGAGVEYVNVYTGASLGMATSSSTSEFTFRQDGSYTSVWKGVDGVVGAQRYGGATYNGRFTVSDWELTVTNRFKGETDVFSIAFEAVLGGRLLHMRRGTIEELTLVRVR